MREDFNLISEEVFLNIIKFHSEQVKDYLEKELYNFIAFYIAKGIEYNAIFDNDFDRIINTALETFDSFQFRNSINKNRVKKLLKNDFSIKIVSENPIIVEKI